jgi:hypothetical protein
MTMIAALLGWTLGYGFAVATRHAQTSAAWVPIRIRSRGRVRR